MFNKTFFKFLGAGLVIAVLGFAAIYGLDYYRYRKSPEYQAQKYFKDLQRRYAEDTYGGDTPEETLQLFIDALKKGDIELASKYFVVDEQEKQLKYLLEVKEKNLFSKMIEDLDRAKLRVDGETAYFTLVRENDFPSELVMRRNAINRKWKIIEL